MLDTARPAPILFSTGRLVGTPAAVAALADVSCSARSLILRHIRGDWSEMCEDDQATNRDALITGGRIFSAYTVGGRKFWVITEADRAVTTILLPEDY